MRERNTNMVSRGQVWFIDEPSFLTSYQVKGSVQAKSRPWLVVSCKENNIHSTTFNAVPLHTTLELDEAPYHVAFMTKKRNQLIYQSILCEQIRTFDIQALRTSKSWFMYNLGEKLMAQVDVKLALQLEIGLPGLVTTLLESVKEAESSARRLREELNLILNPPMILHQDEILQHSTASPTEDLNALAGSLTVNTVNSGKGKTESIEPDTVGSSLGADVTKDTSSPNFKGSTQEGEKRMRVRWTAELKEKFLNDAEKLSPDEMVRQWGFKNKRTFFTYKSKFLKEVKE